ncbi:hypothetical protein Nepgr_023417 [Nepenthes gracilis]|uniref:Myb-like domain-containing protein n=1 Tax=Nepenthes gracilis TaxID=150966 RepID=A0AAD3T178_NEPGR|nr:hypothetical protein Nepgr_023417 [Nepenthes gracilis]
MMAVLLELKLSPQLRSLLRVTSSRPATASNGSDCPRGSLLDRVSDLYSRVSRGFFVRDFPLESCFLITLQAWSDLEHVKIEGSSCRARGTRKHAFRFHIRNHMLGVSSGLLGSSADEGAASAAAHDGGGGVGSSSIPAELLMGHKGSGDDFCDRNSAGNRWPRQETIALLRIRSDMDLVFRDSTLKRPLWEEVSRKMAERAYHRNAKKCKEKFENVYKYHKRTKEGRSGEPEGKTYRFFGQLQALESHPSQLPLLPPPRVPPPQAAVPLSVTLPPAMGAAAQVTVSSTTLPAVCLPQPHVAQTNHTNNLPNLPLPPPPPPQLPSQSATTSRIPSRNPLIRPPHLSHIPGSPFSSPSSSSSTSSDEEIIGRSKRKRKWKDLFEMLMKEVIDKQEDLQRTFLEAIEKNEHDKKVREEAWKVQEMARLSRKHEILAQERSMAAAKDAALISFLQKLSGHQKIPLPLPSSAQPSPSPTAHPQQLQAQAAPVQKVPPQAPPQLSPLQRQLLPPYINVDPPPTNNGENLALPVTSVQWPKAEVEMLIKLRTTLDQKYQDSGPRGPLWEEISLSMRKLGHNRSAKKCKEKWRNINKYFKKVKESKKNRPEDPKTCPYFYQLEALYREKSKQLEQTTANPYCDLKPPPPSPPEDGSMAQMIIWSPEQR